MAKVTLTEMTGSREVVMQSYGIIGIIAMILGG